MNNFLFNYAGNKYVETKKYLSDECIKIVKSKSITSICEPYCGIFGFSRAFYEVTTEHGNDHITYKLNDIDTDLISFYKQLKKNYNATMKPIVNEVMKLENANVSQIRKHLKESQHLRVFSKLMNYVTYKSLLSKVSNFLSKKQSYVKFLKKCTFYNLDAFEFMEKHCENNKTITFVDPPYNFSFNTSYTSFTSNHKNYTYDPTHIFVYLSKSKKSKLMYIGVIDGSSLMLHTFKHHLYKSITKNYTMSNRSVNHIIISNFL
jgi:site-specific DNA-adenine methylase